MLGTNVSDDGYVFKETKLLTCSIRGNHGNFAIGIYSMQNKYFFSEILETFRCLALLISQSHKNFLQNEFHNYLQLCCAPQEFSRTKNPWSNRVKIKHMSGICSWKGGSINLDKSTC